MQHAVRQEIARLEDRRISALVAGDADMVESLMADDLVHIHGTGQIDGKAAYIAGLRSKYIFHRIERGEIDIRVYGDVAIVTGPLSQSVSVKGIDKINEISAIVTQSWMRGADGWKQNTCHMGFLSIT